MLPNVLNVLHAFSPATEGFVFTWLLFLVFAVGLWTAATKRFAWTVRCVKVSLVLGGLGGLYNLVNVFTALGSPNIDPALRLAMLFGGLGAVLVALWVAALGAAILYLWQLFGQPEAKE